ncbi:spore killer candidate 1 [Fusarium napiforme]|uniref:Spore killer candidate 1 n=1 Tax=Fusarium napiforme TaxID=42672 RepID=A0A8H5IMK2_9HYPO|nr:spore killer candidate 1 [Fusarium napiforme]
MNKTTARRASDTLHFDRIEEFEEILDEKLQPINDLLDVIKKKLDDLTNQDLAPKTPPKETDIRPQN